jgi:hypothetical protein
MKVRTIALTLAALSASLTARAAEPLRWPFQVDCATNNDDTVGARLCTETRDLVAKSARYQVSNGSKDDELRFNLHLVSVAETAGGPTSTAWVLTIWTKEYGQTFMDTWVTHTGTSAVTSQAKDIFALVDKDTMDLVEAAAAKETK